MKETECKREAYSDLDMGQNKHGGQTLLSSYMLSDLAVCGLEETEYIQLSKVFTQEHPCPEREHPKSTTSPKVVIPKRHKLTLH